MFEKKVDFYKKKDRDTWLQIRKALAEEGIRHVSAGHYFGDSLAPNGIGGYLDPRNYGANGKIDRDIYYVRVREKDMQAAREAIRRHGPDRTRRHCIGLHFGTAGLKRWAIGPPQAQLNIISHRKFHCKFCLKFCLKSCLKFMCYFPHFFRSYILKRKLLRRKNMCVKTSA